LATTHSDRLRLLEPEQPERRREPLPEAATVDSALALLVELLVNRVADELETRTPAESGEIRRAGPLLTLGELVAELPAGKKPETWKRWLYERTRRGEVPGCVRLGRTLFFETDAVRAWIAAGAPSARPEDPAS
jgi:hypothetical protein